MTLMMTHTRCPKLGAALIAVVALAGCRGTTSLTNTPLASDALEWPSRDGGAGLADQRSEAPDPRDGAGDVPPDSAPDGLLDVGLVGEPPAPSLRLVVLSDLNGSYGSISYSSAVHGAVAAITGRIKPDLVLISGGMVAGQKEGLDYEAMWAAFHAAVTDPLTQAGVPMAVVPGNHDGSGYASYAAERKVFVDQWKGRPPAVDQIVDGSQYPLGYSFIHHGVFFLALDATKVGPLDQSQLSLIDQRLAVAAPKLRIAFGHLPIHPVAVGREAEILGDIALEQLLVKRQVALHLSGHHHGYYPGAAAGLRQISVGALGAAGLKLIGAAEVSQPSLVVVEIQADEVVSVEAYAGEQFDQLVARSSLPSMVVHGSHALTRDDLAGF